MINSIVLINILLSLLIAINLIFILETINIKIQNKFSFTLYVSSFIILINEFFK